MSGEQRDQERMAEEGATGAQGMEESWQEVGRQFQALGESLARAFRTARMASIIELISRSASVSPFSSSRSG